MKEPPTPASDATEPRDDRLAPPTREAPLKRSYTRRRAGARTAPGQEAVDLSTDEDVPGPKPAPTIIEASAAVHREQALAAPDDGLPTMIDRSLFDEEDEDLPPELADFKAALVRASSPNAGAPASSPPPAPPAREESGPVRTAAAGLSAWGRADEPPPDDETSQRFETAGARIPKTKMLSPVELAVELAGADREVSPTEAALAPPRLDGLRDELAKAGAPNGRTRAFIGMAALVGVVSLAVLIVWWLMG